MSTAALILMFLLLPRDSAANLWCYECGTQVAGKPDCEEFHQASAWTPFWRECSKDSICVKILPAWPSEHNVLETVRGCAPRANHRGVVHREGCWSHPTASQSLVCFCGTNFCNAAHATTPLLPAILTAVFAVLLR
ncbi:hypothetical protein GWK47_035125 [Chionoecetes opilio]|uniref:Protein sleepless n=1 Tax=Chionoecetes opilio TaxID=41210 RepID=A0A8J5D3C6_CHIOP|nr:hypothetical protein GWK47_035125 [Chionoecetes opilio]